MRMINATMIKMLNRAQVRDEEGQALVEYALILALIAVFAIGALQALGSSVSACCWMYCWSDPDDAGFLFTTAQRAPSFARWVASIQ